MAALVRLVVSALVLFLLVRSARLAWRNRALALRVWRRIRPHHVVGCVALLAVVVTVAVGLAILVPPTRFGLGTLIGVGTNAVFAPVAEVASRSGVQSPVEGGSATASWVVTGVAAAFLVLLTAMFPWLAYVEESSFRYGLETAGPGRQLWTALRFGLLHLVMLIPVAAALAIGVAGFAYGLAYRHAFRRARRRVVVAVGAEAGDDDEELQRAIDADARDEAVLASTVWHATFNTLVVVVVAVGLTVDALL